MRNRVSAAVLGAGCALLPALLLPGARANLLPLLLLPLFPLAWLAAGSLPGLRGGARADVLRSLGLGLGVLHTLLLLLGLVDLWSPLVGWLLLLLFASFGALRLRSLAAAILPDPGSGPGLAGALAVAGLAAVAAVSLLLVVVPPVDPDGLTYHLALPDMWRTVGGFRHVPPLHYGYMPLGAEMGFLWAALLLPGRALDAWVLANGVGLLYGLLTAAAASSLAGGGGASWRRPLAALLTFCVPAVLLVSVLPYNDAYLAAFLLLALRETLRWSREPTPRTAATAGLFYGLALGAKYTALLAAPALLAAGLVVSLGRVPVGRLARGAGTAALTAVLLACPWYLKTGLATGNPVYPAAFGLLGGAPAGAPAWDAAAAELNARTASHGAGWDPRRWLSAPWRLVTNPEEFGVLPRLGPSFAVACLFVLGALCFGGRREKALAAAFLVLYLSWSVTARNARYLVPALAVGMALTAWGLDRLLMRRRREGLVATTVLVAGLLLWDLFLATTLFHSFLAPGPFLAGEVDAGTYIARRRPNAACLARASRLLPPEATVLLIGETRAMYLSRRFLASGPLEPSPLLWLEARSGERDLARGVAFSGATHAFVDLSGVLGLAAEHDRYRGREEEVLETIVPWIADEEPILHCPRSNAVLVPLPAGSRAYNRGR